MSEKQLTAKEVYNHPESFFKEVLVCNPNCNLDLLRKAYSYAKNAHKGIVRVSGEDYFIHPIGVSLLLLENRIVDTASLCSAFLHDVIEDTTISLEDVKREFGEEIANIVLGLTKLEKNNFKEADDFNVNAYRSENLRKLILATAKDPRVMFVKIADRVDNMRSLSVFRKDKQKRIAIETLHTYAPLAEKLGLYSLKSELEDLCLLYLYPDIYSYLSKHIPLTRKQREEYVLDLLSLVKELAEKHDLSIEVEGRSKHFYSIYSKMSKENKSLDRIYDLYGVRILTKSVEDCYLMQKILLDAWELFYDPFTKKARMKDYIQNPKPSGYKSLHLNFIDEGHLIEVQIRTFEMHKDAEGGSSKHWRYKEHERDKKIDRKIDWIRELISWYRKPSNKEYREHMSLDMFTKEIICITPKADLVIIKEGSTPLDFAYAIHSKIGDHYEKAFVNGNPALMTDTLHSGDIVSIVLSKKPTVSSQWLSIAKTNSARNKIKQTLQIESVQKKPVRQLAVKENTDPLLFRNIVVSGKKAPVKLSKCCNPKPGDEIVGYYKKDKKLITIHTKSCPDRFALNQSLQVIVSWEDAKKSEIDIRIVTQDVVGILGKILDIFSDNEVRVLQIKTKEAKSNVIITITTPNKDEKAVSKSIKAIQSLDCVESAVIEL